MKGTIAVCCFVAGCVLTTGCLAQTTKPFVIPESKHALTADLADVWLNGLDALTYGTTLDGRDVIDQPPAPSLNFSTTQSSLTAEALSTVAAGVALNFEGTDAVSNEPFAAPDPNGAVGATQYVQWVNAKVAVFAKSNGQLLLGPFAANTLWSSVGGPCAKTNNGDGIVLYDKIAGRWIISRHAVGSTLPYYQCIAVSVTSDATKKYYVYAFQLPGSDFPDYPKLGVWPDAYYFSTDDLTPSTFAYDGALVCAYQRSAMLNGGSAHAVCFKTSSTYHSLLPADLDGATLPPSGSPNFFMNLGSNALHLWTFHVNFTTPSLSTFIGPSSIPVASFSLPCGSGALCVPQKGTKQTLDSVGDRLMHRLSYRRFAGQFDTLMATHSIGLGGHTGIRWYQINSPAASKPVVYQQGTYAPDSNYRWMGSIAMDKAQDIAVGYNVSNSNMYPAIRYTGRTATDSLSSMEAESTIVPGDASETSSGRWGDYSSLSIDPADDCTFWYTGEYFKVSNGYSWSTRIASFRFPNCN